MWPTWGRLGPVGPRWAPSWPHVPYFYWYNLSVSRSPAVLVSSRRYSLFQALNRRQGELTGTLSEKSTPPPSVVDQITFGHKRSLWSPKISINIEITPVLPTKGQCPSGFPIVMLSFAILRVSLASIVPYSPLSPHIPSNYPLYTRRSVLSSHDSQEISACQHQFSAPLIFTLSLCT